MFAHRDALRGMVALWNGTPMYSFGYIVPFVSAYLFWTRRKELQGIAAGSNLRLGIPLLLGALGLLAAGQVAGIQVAEQFAFLAALAGAVLLIFGFPALRQAWVPLAYLLLMVPFWDALTEPLHLPFQKLSAALGVKILQSIGVPAHQNDVILYLPNITLEVARACSGVNYLVAVLALGLPLAYLCLPSLLRRLVLIVGAVVIAAVSNGLRVALIGVLAYWGIGSPLHGPFHVLHGLFVSGIGYVVLFAGMRLLTPSKPDGLRPGLRGSHLAAVSPWRSFSLVAASAVAALFVVVGIVLPTLTVTTPVPLVSPLSQLPTHLGPWSSGASPAATPEWWPRPDAQLLRRYKRDGLEVDLAVSYYAFQRQGKELVSHRVDVLHQAARTIRLPLADGSEGEANITTLRSTERDLIALFWYDIDGRMVSGKYRAKWLTVWTTIARRRSNGTVVVLVADRPKTGADVVEGRLQELATLVYAALLPSKEPRA